MMTRKRELNPELNFVQNSPFFDNNQEVNSQYELFEGLGRFNRPESYDFNEGRALTSQRPEDQPDFNPVWVQAYRLSPTIKPGKSAKNPMPRMKNPDPNGYLMAMAETRVDNEAEGKMSISQLLDRKGVMKNLPSKGTEQYEGTKTADEAPEEA
jgi:hypothetical protein